MPKPITLSTSTSSEDRLQRTLNNLEELLYLIKPVPESWLKAGGTGSDGPPVNSEEEECRSYETMMEAWRQALAWTPGLDRALSCMLASVISTLSVGEQLWIKVIGPASCGKTTLCEALAVNKKFVDSKSTIRGFHSGYKSDGAGKEDNSLISKLHGKTLVTKDGDTLLQSPNLGQILSEARDIYDRTSRSHYRHGLNRSYEGVCLTWILCGTNSLKQLDSSELGERFLDCIIMERIDEDLENVIAMSASKKAINNILRESGEKTSSQHDKALSNAMLLTGGYVSHLRNNAKEILAKVVAGLDEDDLQRRCTAYGTFVAYLRARPSKKQDEVTERELAGRLSSQLTRLALCLAGVMGLSGVSQEVYEIVRRVAIDTARGRTLDIIRYLFSRPEGCDTHAISVSLGGQEKMGAMLKFLRNIGAIELKLPPPDKHTKNPKTRWYLSSTLRKLYSLTMEEECPVQAAMSKKPSPKKKKSAKGTTSKSKGKPARSR